MHFCYILKSISIIAFNHHQFNFDEIGLFHLEDDKRFDTLSRIKQNILCDELMYLSTCNRVEFIISSSSLISPDDVLRLLHSFDLAITSNEKENISQRVEVFHEHHAVEHLFSVASSLDSLVVGEREIITQVRKAFEECRNQGLSGDVIRVLIQSTIQTAKKIYTESTIATRPVSVVSLAYFQLKKYLFSSKNILVIGAGKTISSMLKFISKTHDHQFSIYNRSTENAQKLANHLNLSAKVHPLNSLGDNAEDIDLIITCTGSQKAVLSLPIYRKLNPNNRKIIIVDLAVPNDCPESIKKFKEVRTITVNELKSIAEENLKARTKEVEECKVIIKQQIEEYVHYEKQRELERAMQSVPASIKGIREKAFSEVFAKEIDNLDPNARKIVDNVIDYMEKKYISVPMKMAKEILLKESVK